jgi:hypothetical protein
MSHFLRQSEIASVSLHRPIAAVAVKVTGRRELTIDTTRGVFVLDPSKSVTLTRLPPDVVVMAPDGEVIKASRSFWVTTCTIDPFHAAIDAEGVQ